MTSLYPSQHKVINKYSTYTDKEKIFSNLKELSPDVSTLADIFKANGYATGGFTGDAGVGAKFGFGSGFDVYFEGPTFGGMDISIPEAEKWLKENADKKFFMFLHGYDVHGQFDPPEGFTRRYVNPLYKGPLKGGKNEEAYFREQGLDNKPVLLTPEDVRFWRALYDEKINDVDARFAQFIDKMKSLGVLDKTVVVLFSDHGTEFYEHKRFDHGHTLYDELIHVPLIVWLPGRKTNMIVSDQVRAIDVLPTLLELLGIHPSEKLQKQMQGTSLVPLMSGGHMQLPAFSETDFRFFVSKRSIRTPDGYKFIYSLDTQEKELYNLKKDPHELHNIVDREPKVAEALQQKLFDWLKSMGQDETAYKKILESVLKIKEY